MPTSHTLYRPYGDGSTPAEAHGVTVVPFLVELPSSGIVDTDDIQIMDIPAGWVVVDAAFAADATLGAGVTLTLRIGTTAITGKSTATATTLVRMSVLPDQASASDRTLNFLVDDANITAGAGVRGHVILAEASSYGL